jgi:hypothetical protein
MEEMSSVVLHNVELLRLNFGVLVLHATQTALFLARGTPVIGGFSSGQRHRQLLCSVQLPERRLQRKRVRNSRAYGRGTSTTVSTASSPPAGQCGPNQIDNFDENPPPIPITLQQGVQYTLTFTWSGNGGVLANLIFGIYHSDNGQVADPVVTSYMTNPDQNSAATNNGQVSWTFVAPAP